MSILDDIRIALIAGLCFATILLLAFSVRTKGKGWLLGFLALIFLDRMAGSVPWLLFRHQVIAAEAYQQYIMSAGPVFMVLEVASWALLLAFVVSLKSMKEPSAVVNEGQGDLLPMTVSRALFSFEGRLSRGDYWLKGFLPMLPVGIFNNLLAYGVNEPWALAMSLCLGILSLWPTLALVVKRLHDHDRSGWFVFIGLIPVVGTLILAVMVGFLKGTGGPNRFGPDPLKLRDRLVWLQAHGGREAGAPAGP